MIPNYILTLYSSLHFQLHIFVQKKKEYEDNMQDHKEDEEKWKEQELESLQDGYLNYYDTVRLIQTDYENVSANQAILTNVVYLLF